MTNKNLKESLFDEKSLVELLRVYESAFPRPLTAKLIGGWLGLLLFIFLMLLWHLKGIEASTVERASGLLASYALTVSSALMGVVIAGMSIFAASLRPKVANGLIETKYPNTEISSLKFIFSMFAYVLWSLFVVIAICGVFYLALSRDSVLLNAATGIYDLFPNSGLYKLLLIGYISTLFGAILALGSLLRSFIWNLHQVLLVVAVFNGHADDEK